MHKLFRSLSRDSVKEGIALPQVFDSWKQNKIQFYPGDVSMLAGPPGAGKSTLALYYALCAGVETLYISSDMPASLVIKRLLAMKTGEKMDVIGERMLTEEGFAEYSKMLRTIDHLYMDYPARPDPESIATSVMAGMEILGVPHPLLVIDNLMNMSSGNDNEWAGLRELAQVLKYIAKELDIHVMVLHHTNTGVSDLSTPVPYSHIMGKISELPATILTLAKRPGQMVYSPVKNRYGRADATAKIVLSLDYDEERQIISDQKKEVFSVFHPSSRQPAYQDWRVRQYKDD